VHAAGFGFAFAPVALNSLLLLAVAVFYNKADLEIDNGPPFTLSGKVHTNQDMYLSPSSSLTFDTSHIAAAGKFAGSRGDQTVQGGQVFVTIPPTNPDGTVPSGQTTKQWPSGGSVPSGQTAMSSGTGTIEGSNHSNFYADLNTAFGGAAKDPVTDGGNGNPPASKVAFPNISTNTGLDQTTLKYTSGSQYENEAGLKVYTDSVGAVHAFDSTNTEITSKLPAGAITTGSFWDNREGKQVTTIDVDLGKLNALGTDGVNHYPTNGLIYGVNDPSVGAISGSPPSGGSSPLTSGNAIRLTDGAALPVTNDGKGGNGLTVVTPGALYVEGDMNTTSTGGPKMATISDSLNLLSNNWKTSGQDAATTSSHKDNNPATNTTYNMSFVTGNQASVGTSYGGGLENFPRFLENWSGITCTVSGSMVCDTHSKIATGAWGQANVYTPPNRNWSYDRGLVSARPPFVPVTTSVVATVYWVK